ncbi:MAG TPA: hypothetical protein VFG18_08210 [Xanthomonadaceae bacterium]|nr:hypothetical protein [Xanthomonadaceae bacterium]
MASSPETGSAYQFDLYATPSGAFIAVPDCLRPSMEAETRHGPLRWRARLVLDADADGALVVHLASQVEEYSYAVLDPDATQPLLQRDSSTA